MHITYPNYLLFILFCIGIQTIRYDNNNIQLVSYFKQGIWIRQYFKCFMKILYTLCCFCIITVQSSFAWTNAFNNMTTHFPHALLYTIPPLQFCTALYYVYHPHFLSYFQKKSTQLYPCISNENTVIASSIIMFIGMSYIYAQLNMQYASQTVWSKHVENVSYIYMLEILSWIVGGGVTCINICVFFLVFCIHLKELYNIVKNIHYPVHQTILNDTVYKIVKCNISTYKHFNKDMYKYKEFDVSDEVTISEIFYKIVNLKFNISTAILLFQKIYTFITICTVIASAYIVEQAGSIRIEFNVFTTTVIILFFIMQCLFLIIILAISRCRVILLHAIESPIFVYGFLKHVHQKYRRQQQTAEQMLQMNAHMKTSKQVGIQSTRKQTQTRDIVEYREGNLSSEWMMLHRLLSSRWATFSLCGLSFEDGTAIQKGIALSAGIVVITRIANDYW